MTPVLWTRAGRVFLGVLAISLAISLPGGGAHADDLGDRIKTLRLPPGFAIEVLARVDGARSMAPAPDLGVIFVGSRGSDLHAVELTGGIAGKARVRLLNDDLNVPNGIAYYDGWLYVAEQHRVFRYRPRRGRLAPHDIEVLFDGLPDKAHHGWRYAAIGPDRQLYVAVGAPCNICSLSGLEGTVIRMKLDGSGREVFAHGVRNSVGIDFHPATGAVFFTDNGADHMGDDLPPDELNRAPGPGRHYGYPFYGGGRARTAQFMGQSPPSGAVFPVVAFGAHVAALGVRFYRGGMLPAAYRGHAFVAQHGSWNRTVPVGARLMRIPVDASGRIGEAEVFIDGWMVRRARWGRPVDIKEWPDGSMLVSDDRADAIYRITYTAR